MEAPLDTFRSSTIGWLRGTLAGWGTILLILAGIVLTPALSERGVGLWPLALSAVGILVLLVKWVQNLAVQIAARRESSLCCGAVEAPALQIQLGVEGSDNK